MVRECLDLNLLLLTINMWKAHLASIFVRSVQSCQTSFGQKRIPEPVFRCFTDRTTGWNFPSPLGDLNKMSESARAVKFHTLHIKRVNHHAGI